MGKDMRYRVNIYNIWKFLQETDDDIRGEITQLFTVFPLITLDLLV